MEYREWNVFLNYSPSYFISEVYRSMQIFDVIISTLQHVSNECILFISEFKNRIRTYPSLIYLPFPEIKGIALYCHVLLCSFIFRWNVTQFHHLNNRVRIHFRQKNRLIEIFSKTCYKIFTNVI